MHGQGRVRTATSRDTRAGRARRALGPAVVLVVSAFLAALLPLRAGAHGEPDERLPHALDVAVAFPDAGLANGETLCLALFAGHDGDFTAPVQSRCLGRGETGLRFDGLTHGPYTLVVLAPGSAVEGNRYQGQVIATDVPDEPDRSDYALPVAVKLAPEVAGTTGRVQVSVFGCPPGTDAGGDADGWLNQCDTLANDVPVSLSGIGSIEDTSGQAITGRAAQPGRVEFANLPPGDYLLQESLPVEARDAVVFVESSIDGSITPLDPADPTLALRPAEVKSVAYFVVLDPAQTDARAEAAPAADPALGGDADSGNPDIAGGTAAPDAAPSEAPNPVALPDALAPAPPVIDPAITGGLTAEETPVPAE
jgi:hypothetical protein